MSPHELSDYYASIKHDVLLFCPLTAEEILSNATPDELARIVPLLIDQIDLSVFVKETEKGDDDE